MRKQLYQQPITETLVVRFEGNILTASDTAVGGIKNITSQNVIDDSDSWEE